MLIGLALRVVAVFLYCALLFRLSIYALPLFVAFAAPAAVAGYHAVHGIAAATMPPSAWQLVVSLLGAAIIAAASWTQWSRTRP